MHIDENYQYLSHQGRLFLAEKWKNPAMKTTLKRQGIIIVMRCFARLLLFTTFRISGQYGFIDYLMDGGNEFMSLMTIAIKSDAERYGYRNRIQLNHAT